MEFDRLPQPTRPTPFSNLTSFKYSVTKPSIQVDLQDSEASTSAVYREHGEGEEAVIAELTDILLKCLDQVDNVHKALLLQKIFSEVEKESELESFIVERLKHSQVKAIAELLQQYPGFLQGKVCENEMKFDNGGNDQRGLDDDLMEGCEINGQVKQFSHKLGRFKVKTVNPGGALIKK